MLTTYREMYQLGSRYPSTIVPFVFLSAIFGMEQFLKTGKSAAKIRKTMIAFMALSLTYFFLGFFVRYIAITPSVREGHAILKLIPPNASISALGNIYPHLCQREKIWLFPKNWEKADYIIMVRLDPTWPVDGDYGPALQKLMKEKNYGKILEYIFIGETPLPGPLSKKEYVPVYAKIMADKNFSIAREGEHYFLLKRKNG